MVAIVPYEPSSTQVLIVGQEATSDLAALRSPAKVQLLVGSLDLPTEP